MADLWRLELRDKHWTIQEAREVRASDIKHILENEQGWIDGACLEDGSFIRISRMTFDD